MERLEHRTASQGAHPLKLPGGCPRPGFRLVFHVIVLIIAFAFLKPCIRAEDISLFPAASWEHDRDAGLKELTLGYPLFRYSSDGERTDLRIPFIFSIEKHVEVGTFAMDLLWPMSIFRQHPRAGGEGLRRQWYFMLFFSGSNREDKKEGDLSKTVFFPFWFSGRDAGRNPHHIMFPFFWYADNALVYFPFPSTGPQSFFAIFPLFGTFRNLGGNDVIRFYLWPAYIQVRHKDRVKHNIVWPIFGYGTGEEYKSFAVWPLVSWSRRPNGERRLNYLWPLGYHRRNLDKDGEPYAVDLFLPFIIRLRSSRESWDNYFIWGRRETPLRSQWAVLWPLFRTVRWKKDDGRGFAILHFLFRYQKSVEGDVLQIFPLYSRRQKGSQVRTFAPWPLGQYRYDDFGNYTFTRHYFFPFFMRKVEDWQETGIKDTRTFVFPFFHTWRRSDGAFSTSCIRMFYWDKSADLTRNWGSLLPLYLSQGDAAGNYSRRVFWKIYHREHKDGSDLSEVNTLILQWKNRDGQKAVNLLGGLFGYENGPQGRTTRILYIPIR